VAGVRCLALSGRGSTEKRRPGMIRWTVIAGRHLVLGSVLMVAATGCGLTAAQKGAIGRFSRSTAAVGETTSNEMIRMREMVIQMNATSYAIMGKVTDPAVDAPRLTDLDHNFSVSNVDTVVQAATALQTYGELLQALVDDTQQKELKGAAESFVASVNKVPGTKLSADQSDLIAVAIEQLGGLYIEWKKKNAVKTIVAQAKDAVNTVCQLLVTEFDPQQADALGSQFQKVTARLQAEASNAAQTSRSIVDRSVALTGYQLSFEARKRREEIFTKISKAAGGIRDANGSLVTALESDTWTFEDAKAAAAMVKAVADTKLVSQYTKELVDSVRILK
jgi:hypothetical protein